MTALDDMNSDELSDTLEACHILLKPGPAHTLTRRARGELKTLRDTLTARLGEQIGAITSPGDLEARWISSGTYPPAEDDHLPPGTTG